MSETLEEVIERCQRALDEFAGGIGGPVKELFSQREDVTLANPFGPAVRGWEQVLDTLDYAASRFKDGKVTGFERVAEYASDDVVTILEVEQWEARVGENEEVTPWTLRVSSTFRREDGA